ncbi:hypothetical protein [Collinsella tanakaei]|uniref:hypothetical protein n=1 Tax=Collinsella tanakaei TaxID=626935 RepID=UPI0022E68387|nr:hypothetical protein [Collinsella tanakaei]
MLSENKAKLVKKCYLVPKIARYSLLSLFPTGAAAILLVMIDNIALGSNGLGDLQLIAISSVMIAEGILTIACGLSAKATLRSERWRAIERETHGGPTGPDSTSGLNVFALMDLLGSSAAIIAREQGIALPRQGRAAAAVFLAPILLLVLAFTPRFIDSAAQASSAQNSAAQTLSAFQDALESGVSYVMADDPLERRQDSGYQVSGNVTDQDGDIVARISIETDSQGAVDGVVYTASVDIEKTAQENLAFADENIDRLHELIADVDAPQVAAGLFNKPQLPAEFRESFLAGDYYTPLDVDLDNTGDLRAWATFSTDSRDEFDEYSSPRISIFLQANR